MQLQSQAGNSHFGRQAHAVARGLGWFSIGLGLAECLMPQTVSRAVGLPGKEDLVRGYGLREIATGIGILMSRDPEPWIWGRVGGDALDLATLSTCLDRDNPYRWGTIVAMVAVAKVSAVDAACAMALASERRRQDSGRRLIDYSDRSGFRQAPGRMRGAALSDFTMPVAYRTPEPLRPWPDNALPGGALV